MKPALWALKPGTRSNAALKLYTLKQFERLSSRKRAEGALAVGLGESATVALTAHVAHVDERGIDDELVVVDALIKNDEAERSDEPLARRFKFYRAIARSKFHGAVARSKFHGAVARFKFHRAVARFKFHGAVARLMIQVTLNLEL